MLQFAIGLALAVLISIAAFRFQALNRGGAVAAAVLGTITFGLGGLEWAVVLIAFFASSSALSRLAKSRKTTIEEKYSKGGRRDAGQVLANGGAAGLFVLLHAFFPAAAWPWLGFSAALAAANSDTWATELGVLGAAPPRSIITGRQVERGTSGGVSPAGFLASAAGALLIGLLAALLYPGNAALPLSSGTNHWMAVGMVLAFTLLLGLAGLVGSLVDSLLGATLQAVYYCPACRKETERHPLHTCGSLTERLRGQPWLNNDWVNAACTVSGAVFALIVYLVI